MKHLQKIFDRLNLTTEKSLFIFRENLWKGLFTNRIERLLENIIQPDAFFCIDNKPFILFFESLENKSQKLKEIWNFNESPVVFICSEDSVEIYNGFEFLKDNETLQLFGHEEILNDFTYFKLVTGETWEKYQNSLSYRNRVDYHLLQNIKAARDLLIDKKNSFHISPEAANSLLGKVIFVRYLIDRKVKLDSEQRGHSRKWTNQEFCSLLPNRDQVINFFSYLQEKFNGDLFHLTNEELEAIPQESFVTIINLLSGNEIASGQISLFNLYDFSIIPVEFISNVYELFIGKDQQESKGAYYTPLFLVDYILSQTVEKKFLENKGNYTCRILDPSCGSGIFLVETLRKIIERFQINNLDLKKNTEEYKDALKRLAIENLFGIDKDRSAVDVAIFSIYLTLLDYQEPSDIETFKFPLLFGKNFFSYDFFDTEAEFNDVFNEIEFDFILGNPPWKRGKGETTNPLFVQYVNNRSNREKTNGSIQIKISNSEIAQAFVLRVSDFCSPNTKVGLIATSKILYNLNAKRFRQYLLDRFFINKVFELAPVRREVFDKSNDKAITPAVVLFYEYANGKNTDKNVIEHITLKPNRFFSLFKIFTIQRTDYKKVNQSQLKEYDYLWKILVYGSYLDFNLINRLRTDYPKISDTVYHGDKFIVKQGIKRKDGSNKIDVTDLVGYDFIDLNKKQLQDFRISKNLSKWDLDSVGYVYCENGMIAKEMFEPPVLLIKETVKTNLQSVSAVAKQKVVFTDKITSIKNRKGLDDDVYYNVAALLSSELFSYFICHVGSTTGIMIEQQIHDQEKFDFPYTSSKEFKSIISEIENDSIEELFSSDLSKIDFHKQKIDNLVNAIFELSDVEKTIIDYTLRYVIPGISKSSKEGTRTNPLEFKSDALNDYVELFFARFNGTYEKLNQRLIVEIRHTNQIIGLFFKVVSLSHNLESITWIKSENNDIIQTLTSVGTEKITDRLFVQKDIRGFENDGFYVIKPNEPKLWHRAIAHLDVNEFVDAVLVAGKKSVMNVQ